MQVTAGVHRVRRRRVQAHRVRLGVAQGLRVLLDELAATLVVAGRERSVSDRVEGRLVQATTAIDVRRRRRQAVAWSEERRHVERVRGKELPVQDGEVDESICCLRVSQACSQRSERADTNRLQLRQALILGGKGESAARRARRSGVVVESGSS